MTQDELWYLVKQGKLVEVIIFPHLGSTAWMVHLFYQGDEGFVREDFLERKSGGTRVFRKMETLVEQLRKLGVERILVVIRNYGICN